LIDIVHERHEINQNIVLVYLFTLWVTAIKLRKKLPLLLERVGVRRIKNKAKSLCDSLILTFSLRESVARVSGTVHP
jgi:hypothetical protein